MSNTNNQGLRYIQARAIDDPTMEMEARIITFASDLIDAALTFVSPLKLLKATSNIIFEQGPIDKFTYGKTYMTDRFEKNSMLKVWNRIKDNAPALLPLGGITKAVLTGGIDVLEYNISKMLGIDDPQYLRDLKKRFIIDEQKTKKNVAKLWVDNKSGIKNIGVSIDVLAALDQNTEKVEKRMKNFKIGKLQEVELLYSEAVYGKERLQQLIPQYQELQQKNTVLSAEDCQKYDEICQEIVSVSSRIQYFNKNMESVEIGDLKADEGSVTKIENGIDAIIEQWEQEFLRTDEYDKAYSYQIEILEKRRKEYKENIEIYEEQIKQLEQELENSGSTDNKLIDKKNKLATNKEAFFAIEEQEKIHAGEYFDSIIMAKIHGNEEYNKIYGQFTDLQKEKLRELSINYLIPSKRETSNQSDNAPQNIDEFLSQNIVQVSKMSEEMLKTQIKSPSEIWQENINFIKKMQEGIAEIRSSADFEFVEDRKDEIDAFKKKNAWDSNDEELKKVEDDTNRIYDGYLQEIKEKEQAQREVINKVYSNQGKQLLEQSDIYQQLDERGKSVIENMAKSILEENLNAPEEFQNKYEEYISPEHRNGMYMEQYQDVINGRIGQLEQLGEEQKNALYEFDDMEQAFEEGKISVGEYQAAYQKMTESVNEDIIKSFGYGPIEDFDKEIAQMFHTRNSRKNNEIKGEMKTLSYEEFNRLKAVSEKAAKDKMPSEVNEEVENELDKILEAKKIVAEKKAEGVEAEFTDEELARYVEINQELKKTNSQMERKQLTKEKKELEQQAKQKKGSSQGQVVQRVNPLVEYMELVNHKKNMGEYDDDLLKYVNDLQYAYQKLAKTQKEKWALEEQIYQAKKAYRAQLINEVADSERFTQDAYQTMEGYKRLLSSDAGFTEKELKEIYYNMDQAQARAYAQYLQLAQGKYQRTGNERQYVNDLQWGLENRAYTEEQRWQYNREIEQSYLRQAKYAYERSGDERAYLRELDMRISDATLTEQERYQVLQECLGVYEKMTQEAKAQRDILKDSQTALIDFYKNELSVAVDPQKRSMAYDDLFVAANNTVAEAHTQQTESTRLANLYREELKNKFGIWDSDKFFNIRGEVVQSAVEQQLERLPEEQRARFRELISELEKQKKEWYEMEQARLGAISTLQQAYGELQAQQQKAYNKVVDMIRKRKQQELEALEEVHKKRSEQLSDELKQAEKVYERQLNLLDDLKSNDDYQRRLQKETEIRDKLQQRIDLLALDDSDSARMQRLELEKQLKEQEERIAEMQREHEYSEIRKALEEDWKKQQESIEKMQEDNDDRFEREQEKLDERYSEKNIANEANQVLATGQFTEFKEEAIHSYNDIYKHGVRVTQELTNAWKNYAVETGEYFSDLNRYEFTNLFHNLSLITDDMQKIGYWLEAFGYNPNVVFDKKGNGGDTSQTGMSYAHNYQLLLQDIKYRDDELSRAMDVIASRRDQGLSVADQKDYLKTIVDMMLMDFRTGGQGSHKYNKDTLDAIMRQYYYGINGGVEKEYGEAERLYGYLKNDAALRRERIEEIEAYGKIYGLSEGQQAYLDALKALGGATGYSAGSAVVAAYQDQAAAYGQFAPTMNLTPVIQNTNTIGDVYINVEGNADAQTVQALQDAGGTILDRLGTELRGSGMRL